MRIMVFVVGLGKDAKKVRTPKFLEQHSRNQRECSHESSLIDTN